MSFRGFFVALSITASASILVYGQGNSFSRLRLQEEKPTSKIEEADKLLLGAGKKVFVEKADKDVDVAMAGDLQKWGRWKVVGDASEADLLIRLRVSGSAVWGVGHVQAFILEPQSKRTIYSSRRQRGTRTIFHGYASPFSRAISGIVDKMKKDISW